MKQNKHLTQQGEIWRKSLRMPFGDYNERTKSDETEREFWNQMMSRKGGYEPDPYSHAVADATLGILAQAGQMDSILEIGPGWGNYTLRLAEQCRELVCVDISEDVLRYIQKVAVENGVSNIGAVFGKWEEAITTRCDMVFAYNCFYRMRDIEDCLLKINGSANKLCVIGMSGSPEQPYLSDFDAAGLQARYTRMNHHNLNAILGELGIEAHMMDIPNEREYVYESFDELFNRAAAYLCGEFDTGEVEKILRRYYRHEKGYWRCIYKFISGLIWWSPV